MLRFKFICQLLKFANKWNLTYSNTILIMRGESRSTSKSPFKNNEFKADRPPSEPPSNKVYVSFLPEDIDEPKLRQIFSQCGSISRLFLKKKEDGFTFAHITYQTLDEARDAIEKLNKRRVNNKNIKVQYGREFARSDSKDSRDSRDRNQKFGERDRFNKGENRQQSDTRRRFENQGGFDGRGRGRGRGGRDHDRGGFREDGFGKGERGGDRGERGPMKCFKCQGQGHISKNCPIGQGKPNQGGESKQSKPFKPIDKMSEDQCSDY